MSEELNKEEKYKKILSLEGDKKYRLTGIYKDWYLDYASYTNLDRAIPHISDGLKPVQRRILHAMKRMEDGRYNKVANIVGQTMQFHPHGDASIGDALVQLGQKELLIDTQGNWGNILTGDSAAAPRYIEARLSKFALEVAFNNKITEWIPSYDGRNQEPVALPLKFPLLLAQGTQGIGVGLAATILPHNFNELIDACIAYYRGQDFTLYPDFPTGGLADCSHYGSGLGDPRNRVKVRSRIVKVDKKTLAITEIPYTTNTADIIQSIIAANEKGKIKIRKVDDNTAATAEIIISLANDVSPDKTIDALYAFTRCEISIAPDACVIKDNKPCEMRVEDILKFSAERTRTIFKAELDLRMSELEDDWHFSSLEKIFFEEKIYRQLENDSRTWEAQLGEVFTAMKAFQDRLRRPITPQDIDRLVEKPVRKISKFDIKKANEHIRALDAEMDEVENHLAHLTDYCINYFQHLKEKYGANFPRRTELCDFEHIEAAKVVIANYKLYINRAEGFIGLDLKKDPQAEYVCDCSELDEILVFLRNGKYLLTKVKDKYFVGKDILYAGVFKKNDLRTTYNVAYRDGRGGTVYVKRFCVSGIARDKEYDCTQGKDGTQIVWFTVNPNGEAETIRVTLRPRAKLKKLFFEYAFSSLEIKGRGSRGNILSKYPIHKITLKERGAATFGGQEIWFDADIQRLSADPRGRLLGAFLADDRILAITRLGTFYTTNFDLSNRYQEELADISKFDPEHIYTALYFDTEANAFYIKRFKFVASDNQPTLFISDAKGSYFVDISTDAHPQVRITFAGKYANRPAEIIDAYTFIADKSFRAKGKKASPYPIQTIEFIEPQPDQLEIADSDTNLAKAPDNDSAPDLEADTATATASATAADPEEQPSLFPLDFELEGPVTRQTEPKKAHKKKKSDPDEEIQMTLL